MVSADEAFFLRCLEEEEEEEGEEGLPLFRPLPLLLLLPGEESAVASLPGVVGVVEVGPCAPRSTLSLASASSMEPSTLSSTGVRTWASSFSWFLVGGRLSAVSCSASTGGAECAVPESLDGVKGAAADEEEILESDGESAQSWAGRGGGAVLSLRAGSGGVSLSLPDSSPFALRFMAQFGCCSVALCVFLSVCLSLSLFFWRSLFGVRFYLNCRCRTPTR
mmetsp:Transcript_12414/g.37602  ORF Transcript_12414/g.37602 Transcript_12414/m.37602 type:complete len:221 (+) Transcript_12414:2381-3043(+)